MGRWAETLEQVYMPGFAGRQGNVVIATDALENVLNAIVKLRQEGGGSGLLTDRWLPVSDNPAVTSAIRLPSSPALRSRLRFPHQAQQGS